MLFERILELLLPAELLKRVPLQRSRLDILLHTVLVGGLGMGRFVVDAFLPPGGYLHGCWNVLFVFVLGIDAADLLHFIIKINYIILMI